MSALVWVVFTREGTHRDPDQCRCQMCGGTASSWHSMMSLIMSDLQVRLHRLRLQLPIVGGRGSQAFTSCKSVNSASTPELHRIAHDACCLWLLIDCNFLLGIVGRRDSQTFTSCSSAIQVCDRELLHSGCLLCVLWLSILYLQCRLDVLHNWLRCLDHHQRLLQLLVRCGNTLTSMNISAEKAFISSVSHFNGHFMTLNLAV